MCYQLLWGAEMASPEAVVKTVTETTVPMKANEPISVRIETNSNQEFRAKIVVSGDDLKKVVIKAKRPKERSEEEKWELELAGKLYDRVVGNDLVRYRMFINKASLKLVRNLKKLFSSFDDVRTTVENELDKVDINLDLSAVRRQKNPFAYIIDTFTEAYNTYLSDVEDKLPGDVRIDPNTAYATYVDELGEESKDTIDAMCRALKRGRLGERDAEKLQQTLEAVAGRDQAQNSY